MCNEQPKLNNTYTHTQNISYALTNGPGAVLTALYVLIHLTLPQTLWSKQYLHFTWEVPWQNRNLTATTRCAAIHRVTKIQTQLSNWTTTTLHSFLRRQAKKNLLPSRDQVPLLTLCLASTRKESSLPKAWESLLDYERMWPQHAIFKIVFIISLYPMNSVHILLETLLYIEVHFYSTISPQIQICWAGVGIWRPYGTLFLWEIGADFQKVNTYKWTI